jgi:hypothetical protein
MIHAHHKYVLLEAVQDMYGDIMNTCFLTMAQLPSFPATQGYMCGHNATATNGSGTASLHVIPMQGKEWMRGLGHLCYVTAMRAIKLMPMRGYQLAAHLQAAPPVCLVA